MFANRSECTADCERIISGIIGNCNFAIRYNPFELSTNTGAFILVENNNTGIAAESTGCQLYALNCEAPVIDVLPNVDSTACAIDGFELQPFTVDPVFSAKYFTLPNRRGDSFNIGQIITQSIKLYAHAYADCNPALSVQDSINIIINQGPQIPFQSTQACGFHVLPPFAGTNLSPNVKYYTGDFGTGTQYLPGDIIRSSVATTIRLYAYDVDTKGCAAEGGYFIQFLNPPTIVNPKDTTVPCRANYLFPAITGTALTPLRAYYTESMGGGNRIGQLTPATMSGTYFVYDTFYNCFDEDTFRVTLIPVTQIPKDTIRNDTFCNQLILPDIQSASLIYNTARNFTGVNSNPGDILNASTKLYVKATAMGCETIDSVQYTYRELDLDPITIDEPCKPLLDALPPITGANLTAQVAYWTLPGGKGQRYLPGDSVLAAGAGGIYQSTTLYAFDSVSYLSGSCTVERTVEIPFHTIVELTSISDTVLACGQTLEVPLVKPDQVYQGMVYPDRALTSALIPGSSIPQSGTYYVYASYLSCSDLDSFSVQFNTGPQYFNNIDLSDPCSEVTLLPVNGTDFNPDSTFYFRGTFGTGDRFSPGMTVNQADTFYIFDLSQPMCLVQDTVVVSFNSQQGFNLPASPWDACDSIRLPNDPTVGNLQYIVQNGDAVDIKFPGDWITSSMRVEAVGGDPNCPRRETITIRIAQTPELVPMRDTLLCDPLRLPVLTGKNLADPHYHTLPNDGGESLYAGDTVFQTGTYYPFSRNGACVDEDTVQITIVNRPRINKLTDQRVCEKYILPLPAGANLDSLYYYDDRSRQGERYAIGDTLRRSMKIYAYQDVPLCPAIDSMVITVLDSTTTEFMLSDTLFCVGTPLLANHTGDRGPETTFTWAFSGSTQVTFKGGNADQRWDLGPGNYNITLSGETGSCDGPPTTHSVRIHDTLAALTGLNCTRGPDNIAFRWNQVPGALEYGIELLAGPTGVRTPFEMLFSNLAPGQPVGIRVTPLGGIPCANGQADSLVCFPTVLCEPVTVEITQEGPFCSGDGPIEPVALIRGASDPASYTRTWSGPGMVRDTFYPAQAGPGEHIITFTLTRDSCIFTDTVVFRVGGGSVQILNDQGTICNPADQDQFNIRMFIDAFDRPYDVHYTYNGRPSAFPSGSDTFTLSVRSGVIRIDSVVDASGCSLPINSMAGTDSFRLVQPLAPVDTQFICDFGRRAWSYQVVINNPNPAEPMLVLSGGGTFQDSLYTSPPVPFGQRHLARISRDAACDTLVFDLTFSCDCTPHRDTVPTAVQCEGDTVVIGNRTYTAGNPFHIDTIPPSVIGACDTFRVVNITFLPRGRQVLNPVFCPGDTLRVGNVVFSHSNPTGEVYLPGMAANGCDSVVVVQGLALNPVTVTIRDTICAGDTLRISGIEFHNGHRADSVRLAGGAANGCDSVVYFFIHVETLQAEVTQESSGCGALTRRSILVRNVTGGSFPYSFSTNIVMDLDMNQFPFRTNLFGGDSFDLVIRSAFGCESITPIGFTPISSNQVMSLGPDREIILGDTAHLGIQSNYTIGSLRWLSQNSLSCTNCLNPVASPLRSSLYILEASDANGCPKRDSLWILVDPDINIFVPNLINTSSTDDRNRLLFIHPPAQVQSVDRFTLFDRWGTLIMSHDQLGPGGQPIEVWDGRFRNEDAPPAVYVYKLEYTTFDGKQKVKYGDVTLIR